MSLIVVVHEDQLCAFCVAEQLFDAHRVSVPEHRCPILEGKVDEVAQLKVERNSSWSEKSVLSHLHPWQK